MRSVLGLFVIVLSLSGLAPPRVVQAVPAASSCTLDSLWFGVRVNASLVDWFNEVARPDDVAAGTVQEMGLLDQIQVGRKQLLLTSVAEAEKVVPGLADRIDIIGYDLEHWPRTPADEQADPVAAVQRLQALARQHGLAVALGPDNRFATEYGAAMAPYVDKFSIQLQRAQKDPQALLTFAQPLIQDLRKANPNLEINIQLRTEGSVEDLLAIVDALKCDIDGVSIIYGPATVPVAQEFVNRLRSAPPANTDTPTPSPAPPTATTSSTPIPVVPSDTPTATPLPPSPTPGTPTEPGPPSQGGLEALWFGVRVNASLVDWFNEVARPGDVAAGMVQEMDLLDQIQVGRKQLLLASVDEAEKVVPGLADRIDIIGYDLEHWPRTPADEQADPVAALQRLQALAKQYDLAVALGPDRRFAVDYGAAMAPYADKFSLQLQRLQNDPEALIDFALPLIHELRQANPDLEINIQLRTEGSVDDLLAIVEALKNDIEGVAIIYGPDSVGMAQEFVDRLRAEEVGVTVTPTQTETIEPPITPEPGITHTPITLPPPTAIPQPTPSTPTPISTYVMAGLCLLVLILTGAVIALGLALWRKSRQPKE